jgi:voltage-gated potassium channel Kch
VASLSERRRRQLRRDAFHEALKDPSAVVHLPPADQPTTSGAPTDDSIAIQAPHKPSPVQQENSSVKKSSFGEQFRYRFDNVMARGTGAIIALLGLVTLIFILVVAAILEVFHILPQGEKASQFPFGEALWQNLLRTLDTGTMASDEGWGYRIASLIITLVGIFVAASLIGIISSAFDNKVEDLRKGGSKVLEKEHTLILGWSAKVFPIVSELLVANESRRRASIVILADYDKIEMDDAIRSHFPKTGNTRVITRSGDPMSLIDLELGSPGTARSVIILAPEGADDPDSLVIKTTLALTNNPNRSDKAFHIVGEIQDPQNIEAANLVGKDEAHWVLASDLISRITVQTCRQSGLSVVYTELLDFDGDEIYFSEQPSLVGTTYFDTQLAFADSTVMGIVKPSGVLINPPATTLYEAGDQLILIAEDDSTIHLGGGPGVPDTTSISTVTPTKKKPEHTLVLGYNAGLAGMLSELSEYVAPGSTVTAVADVKADEFDATAFPGMAVTFTHGDTTSRSVLEGLDVKKFDHIIVLAYKETLDNQRADAKTLITLLHLRDIGERSGVDLNVVSEMLDDRNRELAEVTKADDFIVSDKLISLMLSQVSENKQLTDVFDTLFSSEGSEIYLRPADLYIAPGATVDFYSVLEAARRRGETAIGYRIAVDAHNADRAYGVSVNPKKTDAITFADHDKVIVLAED